MKKFFLLKVVLMNLYFTTNGAEVEAIKKALVKAKAAAHKKPLTELIADCKGFIDRAEKRLVKLEAERVSETTLLEEGRARLAHLEAQVAVGVQMPPAAPSSESRRIGQCAGSLKHQCRPPTSEETLARGFCPKHCRGGSVVDEMPATRNGGSNFDGREADVSRLAAVQLRQWTEPLSSVGNMVS